VAGSRSSTSSSRSFLLDLAVALLVLLFVEWQLQRSLAPLEASNAALAESAAPAGAPAGFVALGSQDPAAFLARLRAAARPPDVVFIGDSQGMVVKDGGVPYPQLVARTLASRGDASVVSLHLGGADTFEQGTLALGLLAAGVVPRAVLWSHSVFSLRMNEIRAELVPLYGSLPAAVTGRPAVILVGGPPASAGAHAPFPRRQVQGLEQRLEDAASASATVRFSRRTLPDKVALLWGTPLGRLVPAGLRPRAGEQRDPSASVLASSAAFAGRVTGVLRARGVRVVHFLSPIDPGAEPRPFSARAEAAAYPALERAVRASGGELEKWLDLVPHAGFGRYADGSDDAFHVRAAGHDTLAQRIVGVLDAPPRHP